jgi:hypothetical protein
MATQSPPEPDDHDRSRTPEGGSAPATTRSPFDAWRWPLVVIVLGLLAFVGARQSCRAFKESRDQTIEAVAGIADRFATGTITTTFTASIPRLVPDGGTKLELAVIEATETFTRSDDRRILFDMVPLGTTVTEIRVPVTYRYHLRLEDPWRLEVSDHACVVHAPRIQPTLPPAIHTDGLSKHISGSWLRFDEDEQMAELERSLTELLSRRASDPDSIDLVRGTCRRQVADFVRNWLLLEDHWRQDRFRSVTVVFADEEIPEPSSLPPTLLLEAD